VKFVPTALTGAYTVELELREDDRGFFARTFCEEEFAAAGLVTRYVQGNVSGNHRAGTVRGLHFQRPPHAEVKVVRCTRGAIVDVIVDLRSESPTFLEHVAVELNEDNRRSLYVPERFAHGYQTLTDGAEVTYLVSTAYTPGAEGGLRHDDPVLAVTWPLAVAAISPKDASWPLLAEPREAAL
jgi:dTDP-4-dehydrorhamnose 3,5-epimerase